jgi:hypothetical protein
LVGLHLPLIVSPFLRGDLVPLSFLGGFVLLSIVAVLARSASFRSPACRASALAPILGRRPFSSLFLLSGQLSGSRFDQASALSISGQEPFLSSLHFDASLAHFPGL